MPFFIVRQDITKMRVDAIVSVINDGFSGDDGTDITTRRLKKSVRSRIANVTDPTVAETDEIITGVSNLPCKYVIHTVGPVWKGGSCGEKTLLKSCYEKSLALAKENGAASVAFPLISCGTCGYPKDEAFRIASDAIREFLAENDADVYLVVSDKQTLDLSEARLGEIRKYIADNYIEPKLCVVCEYRIPSPPAEVDEVLCDMYDAGDESMRRWLNEELANLDESFSEMLFRLIDEKGMTDVECYRKANIDRKVFSKMRNVRTYRPSKTTAVAFALALELPIDDAEKLIEAAGYSLTRNNVFDVIVEYFIFNKKYDVFEINEVLFEFGQKLLGC